MLRVFFFIYFYFYKYSRWPSSFSLILSLTCYTYPAVSCQLTGLMYGSRGSRQCDPDGPGLAHMTPLSYPLRLGKHQTPNSVCQAARNLYLPRHQNVGPIDDSNINVIIPLGSNINKMAAFLAHLKEIFIKIIHSVFNVIEREIKYRL